ncbi:uncharacterized protein ATNIH1004_010612 [Aspergillus tanneri]|uniref:Uncharacterized protein n=1 Tax=Aspergillus tanneri TaxID=1220188 RepID=A0A5M9MM81_9EURO|nr:uncharacterized protein ATNIH1004_010612 [Aspergillus tanneri]KAA8643837.1 hypothetical protein ATNIH1004_010612 [Aspergillus tanneri]
MYSSGLDTFYYRGHLIVAHPGRIAGSSSYHFFVPGFNFGGTLRGNSDGAGNVAYILARELIDEVMYVPKEERPPGDLSRPEHIRSTGNLSLYAGSCLNSGYHIFTVQIRNGTDGDQLFIDALDISEASTAAMEHVCNQTHYIMHMKVLWEEGDSPVAAEFFFEGDSAVRSGLVLDNEYTEPIWFDRH